MEYGVNKPFGTIKSQWDGFVVQEVQSDEAIPLINQTVITGATSPYTLFWMTKRGVESGRAYYEIADQLGISRQQLSSAGLKDACAHTAQALVVSGEFKSEFNHSAIWLRQIGPTTKPLRAGAHEGNQFLIKVSTDSVSSPIMPSTFRNYFGQQRFGDGFIQVGKFLLEGRFEEAAFSLQDSHMNGAQLKQLQEMGLSNEAAMLHPLMSKIIGFKLLQWQSWLWNELATSVQVTQDNLYPKLPLWSLETSALYNKFWDPKEIDEGMHSLLHKFNRKVFIPVEHRVCNQVVGGFEYEFLLPAGAYATVYLNTMYDITDISRST